MRDKIHVCDKCKNKFNSDQITDIQIPKLNNLKSKNFYDRIEELEYISLCVDCCKKLLEEFKKC